MTLVVGATGSLGGRVVKTLLANGKRVRALVRETADISPLPAQVEIVSGDMLDPSSVKRAMAGASIVVTTAAGYTRRSKGESQASVDDLGNRNLIDAAREANIGLFVFTSVLTCEKARDVPQFWQKKLIEDYLEASGVPFIALRPGALLGSERRVDFWGNDLKKGRLTAVGPTDACWTSVHVDDVARCLALAVDEPRAVGHRIDVGMDRPFSVEQAASVFGRLLGREIEVRGMPWSLLSGAARVIGTFNPLVHDLRVMFEYVFSGDFVADTTLQGQLFGPVPGIEDSFRRYLMRKGLVPMGRGSKAPFTSTRVSAN